MPRWDVEKILTFVFRGPIKKVASRIKNGKMAYFYDGVEARRGPTLAINAERSTLGYITATNRREVNIGAPAWVRESREECFLRLGEI